MSIYIYSTLTNSQRYPIWRAKDSRSIPKMESFVEIAGGANVATKHLWTPKGVCTEVTELQYERLQESPGFQRHVARKFLTVEKEVISVDEVAADMVSKDGAAPKVPGDYVALERSPPVTPEVASKPAPPPPPEPQKAISSDMAPNPAETATGRRRRGVAPAA